jgi:O-antigen/teichoic acid export membrane protein
MTSRRAQDPEPPAQGSLVSNTVAQSAPLFVGYLASFLSAPIVLSSLGLRAFGIWALTGAFAQYGGLLDLGVGRALSRFVALYDGQGDRDSIGETVAVGLLSVPIILIPVAAAALVAAKPLAHHLHGISVSNMRLLLGCSVVLLGSTMMNSALAAYPVGLRRMVRPNVALMVGAVANFVFSIVAVLSSHSLEVYAEANAAASLLSVSVMLIATATIRPPLPIRRPRAQSVRALLSFALKDQFVRLSTLINFQSDKIVIALFVGPAAAGGYELANRVAGAALAVAFFTVSALVPTVTADIAQRGFAAASVAYERLVQRSCSLSFPFLFLVIALSPALLFAWLGRSPTDGAVILTGLSLGYIATTVTGVPYSFAAAVGRPGLSARAGMFTATANVCLTVLLAPLLGTLGVLAGTVVALAGGAAFQVVSVHRSLRFPLSTFARAVLPPLAVAAVLAAPLACLAAAPFVSGRLAQAALCILGGLVYMGAYVWVAARRQLLPEGLTRRLPFRTPRIGDDAPAGVPQ